MRLLCGLYRCRYPPRLRPLSVICSAEGRLIVDVHLHQLVIVYNPSYILSVSSRQVNGFCRCVDFIEKLLFSDALVSIGKKLIPIATQELRNTRLRAELVSLNLNLPARVWLPLHQTAHYILRIPPQTAAVLNSKDKVHILFVLNFFYNININFILVECYL